MYVCSAAILLEMVFCVLVYNVKRGLNGGFFQYQLQTQHGFKVHAPRYAKYMLQDMQSTCPKLQVCVFALRVFKSGVLGAS